MIGAYLATHISPNDLPYIYFLGLGYPVLLGLTGFFIVFWLFFRRKYIWFNLIVIILGWNHLNDFYAYQLVEKSVNANSLKILSYNVKIFNLYDIKNREKKRDGIFSFLRNEDPDIVCFQEFYHQKNATSFVTKDLLLQQLNHPYYQERYTHKMNGDKYFGVATFSKYRIINRGEIAFENDMNNFCIYSDIVKGNDTIRVFNAHIGSIRLQNEDYAFFENEDESNLYKKNQDGKRILSRLKVAYEKRALQIEKIQKEIIKSSYKTVLCGDLNDTPVSYCYRLLESVLSDAFIDAGEGIGTTYIGKVPSNRIDYIFHSDDMEAVNFTTHNLNYSDHKPISSIINL